MVFRYEVDYSGEKITEEETLNRLGVKATELYCLICKPKDSLQIDRKEERFVLGKNLLETLQLTDVRGNICIHGPVKIIGENQ